MPGYEWWSWDFRPLARGLPAVPMPTSGRDGVMPNTGVAVDQLGVDDAGFADQAIVSEMMHGIADDSTCQRGTLLCAPHASALRHYDVAAAKIEASETHGWATGGWELPCWPLRTSPYGVVDAGPRQATRNYDRAIVSSRLGLANFFFILCFLHRSWPRC